jgi:hypothetical protein
VAGVRTKRGAKKLTRAWWRRPLVEDARGKSDGMGGPTQGKSDAQEEERVSMTSDSAQGAEVTTAIVTMATEETSAVHQWWRKRVRWGRIRLRNVRARTTPDCPQVW